MKASGEIRLGTHGKTFKEVGHSINGDHLSHQGHDVPVRKTKHISEKSGAEEIAQCLRACVLAEFRLLAPMWHPTTARDSS